MAGALPAQEGVAGPQGGNPVPQGGEAAGSFAEQVKAKIQVPAELRKAYEQIILAGMKLMFDEKTHQAAMEALRGDGPIEQRLAKGVSDLMALLWQQSNQTLPPQLIIPAAVELLSEAADFLSEGGGEETLTVEQTGEAMRLMIGMILERFGVNKESVQSYAQGQAPAQGQGAPPAQAPGVIGGAMTRQNGGA
jgi:hypothetical protein